MVTETITGVFVIFIGFLLLVILLGQWRNYLFQKLITNQATKFFPPLAELNTRKKAFVYLGLVSATLFSIFVLAQFFSLSLENWQATAIIIIVVVGSFLLILNLQTVLSIMRKNKQLSFSFFFNPHVLKIIALIIALEFSLLYWIKKEATAYFVLPFLGFVGIYSILILVVAIFVGLSLRVDNKNLVVLSFLDAIIITLLANTFLCLFVLTFILFS